MHRESEKRPPYSSAHENGEVWADEVRILWIDDQKTPSDPDVRLLEQEGFQIDLALTGAEGLTPVRNCEYQVILLDLRLPDIPGLSVLANLRAEKIKTPVLVVTGFGDLESAHVAGQLGAAGFKPKLGDIDELQTAIELLVASRRLDAPSAGNDDDNPESVRQTASFRSVGALLEDLHRLTRAPVPQAVWDSDSEVSDRQTVMSVLIRALLDHALPLPAFLACAKALKNVIEADRVMSVDSPADKAQHFILETVSRPRPKDTHVIAALRMLEEAAAHRKRLKLEEIAKTQHVDASHLSRLFEAETGFHFTAWRSGYLLRPSLKALVETNEQVKQIACRLLGFKYQAQFDEEFERTFGIAPTEFRKLARNTRQSS
jgi:DNA-binding response OmpR family regulator/AraC-like DNA-binding protein